MCLIAHKAKKKNLNYHFVYFTANAPTCQRTRRRQLQDATAAEEAAHTKIKDVSQTAKDELMLAKRRRAADFKYALLRPLYCAMGGSFDVVCLRPGTATPGRARP